MTRDFHIKPEANNEWILLSQEGVRLVGFRRRGVAEAFGKALAHRAKASLVVHQRDRQSTRYSGRDLTYAIRLG